MEEGTFAQCEAYYAPLGRWFEARAYPAPEGIIVFYLDISERKRAEQALVRVATHDALTGLMNRSCCISTLEGRLDHARERHEVVGLLFIDLDRFKEINDAFGHRVGDDVLREVGQRFEQLHDDSHIPARVGGDEFIFIVTASNKDALAAFASVVIERLRAPFVVQGAEVVTCASIGIAMDEEERASADDLISYADTVMYAAKDAGRHTYAFYTSGVQQARQQRFQLRKELTAALKSGQFELFYQPQCSVVDGSVVGAEALLRWRHPQYGLLTPDAFLPIAEESAFILDLGLWVFDQVCRQAQQWQHQGHVLKISVNVSARQLSDRSLPASLKQAVQRYGIDPSTIKLEITESMLAQDFQVAADILAQLKLYGFRIALDDFGTGIRTWHILTAFPLPPSRSAALS